MIFSVAPFLLSQTPVCYRSLIVRRKEEIFTERFLPLYPQLFRVAAAMLGASSEKKILDYVSRIIDGNDLEMLLEINSNNEMIKIYGIVPPQGTSVLKSALIISREGDELSVVYIEGIIDIDKLNRE